LVWEHAADFAALLRYNRRTEAVMMRTERALRWRSSMQRATILSVLSALLTSPSVFAGPYSPRVGERHPDFVLPTIRDGKAVALSQFRGKKVLLIQFASW
jgi:hypothetical protein